MFPKHAPSISLLPVVVELKVVKELLVAAVLLGEVRTALATVTMDKARVGSRGTQTSCTRATSTRGALS